MSYTKMTQDIISVIRQIPLGYVSSYGMIALTAGYPNGARQVVRVLNSLSLKESLPWHRVVNKEGKIMLSGGDGLEQIAQLKSEGVLFSKEGIVDHSCFYDFKSHGGMI